VKSKWSKRSVVTPCTHRLKQAFALTQKMRATFALGAAVVFMMSVQSTSVASAANTSVKSVSGNNSRLSFSCNWTEPFDSMEIANGLVSYSFSGDKPEILLNPALTRIGTKVRVQGTLVGKPFAVLITNISFTDSEPEAAVPYSVSIIGGEGSVNGGKGGCIRYGDGTTPRTVIGVATDDVLNIRSQAKATAPILDTASNGERIWVYPNTLRGSWMKVSTFRDGTTTSKGTVLSGWINAKFLSPS
jgi:uncharacterized membrane protein